MTQTNTAPYAWLFNHKNIDILKEINKVDNKDIPSLEDYAVFDLSEQQGNMLIKSLQEGNTQITEPFAFEAIISAQNMMHTKYLSTVEKEIQEIKKNITLIEASFNKDKTCYEKNMGTSPSLPPPPSTRTKKPSLQKPTPPKPEVKISPAAFMNAKKNLRQTNDSKKEAPSSPSSMDKAMKKAINERTQKINKRAQEINEREINEQVEDVSKRTPEETINLQFQQQLYKKQHLAAREARARLMQQQQIWDKINNNWPFYKHANQVLAKQTKAPTEKPLPKSETKSEFKSPEKTTEPKQKNHFLWESLFSRRKALTGGEEDNDNDNDDEEMDTEFEKPADPNKPNKKEKIEKNNLKKKILQNPMSQEQKDWLEKVTGNKKKKVKQTQNLLIKIKMDQI